MCLASFHLILHKCNVLLYVLQSVDIVKYTDEEYEKFLVDPVGGILILLLSDFIANGITSLLVPFIFFFLT